MTKQALTSATRAFKFFPTISELATFFTEARAERRQSRAARSGGDDARINSLARVAMRKWPMSAGFGFWGSKACEWWHLQRACAAVRDGAIDGSFKIGKEFSLWRNIPAPVVPEHLLAIWSDETTAQAAYLERAQSRAP